MGKFVTVSTRIPKELEERLRQLDIKPSKLLRKAVEAEIKRRDAQKLGEQIQSIKLVLDKVSMEEIVDGIRADRNLVSDRKQNSASF